VGGLARGGRVVVLGYAAGTETTMRVTDLVWKLAHVSGFSLFAASAEEQAAAYAAVLPLIASGEIVPRPPTGPSRSGGRPRRCVI
jgi:NADPH:quinone reductase-like Zn-dependent oxidoreductase